MDEFALLADILDRKTCVADGHITIGPGDDTAAIQAGDLELLVAVDQLVVGRHVEHDCPPQAIGRKAIARALSDVAAMAGSPMACLVAARLPADAPHEWAMAVFDAAADAAKGWCAPVIGGDIAAGEGPASLSVTVLGRTCEGGAVQRSGARIGDVLAVTGCLGGAGGGHHLTFSPRLNEARTLHDALGADLHAMIDLSDGLGRDAAHMASGDLRFVLEADAIPCREGCDWEDAMGDGEDYELLMAIDAAATLPDLECPLAVVGQVVERDEGPAVQVRCGGDLMDVSNLGWSHGMP